MASAEVVVLCSTGLSAGERLALERAAARIDRVEYSGDLTDRTTHLLVRDGSVLSEKTKCARRLHLPLVSPAWVSDSLSGGTLLPLDNKYLCAAAADENAPPQLLPQPPGPPLLPAHDHIVRRDVCSFVREPLALLRAAQERGELSVELPRSVSVVTFDGRRYALDAPTGLVRHHALPTVADSAAADNACVTSSSVVVRSEQPPSSGAYTLRELLFALRHAPQSHAQYFLACVTNEVGPVMCLDKKLLIESVLPLASDASAGHAACDDDCRLQDAPLRRATLNAIDPQQPTPPPLSHSQRLTATTAVADQGAALDASERSRLLSLLHAAAEERARLNAQVADLSQRLRAEAAAADRATAGLAL